MNPTSVELLLESHIMLQNKQLKPFKMEGHGGGEAQGVAYPPKNTDKLSN
jgi:hypothetical protein